MVTANEQNSNNNQKNNAKNGSDWRKVVGQSFSSLLMPEHAHQAQANAPKPTPSEFAPEYYDHAGQLKGLEHGNCGHNIHYEQASKIIYFR